MDAKITKARIGHMLSYDWIKIVALCAIAVVVWILLFTTLAPRATEGQKLEVYVYPNVDVDSQAFGGLDKLHREGALSYNALDYSVNELTDESVSVVLPAHFGAGQGDIMFVSSYRYDSGQKDEEGNAVMTSDLEKFVSGYVDNCVWLGGEAQHPFASGANANTQDYLGGCGAYLGRYFPDGLEGALDRQAAEEDFRARIGGDNRYKTEEQTLAGIEDECARLEALRDAYLRVCGYLKDGTISVTKLEMQMETGEDENGDGVVDSSDVQTVEVYFSFDLSDVPGLENLIATDRSEEGTTTAQSVNMVILNTRLQEECARYEQVTYLDYIVRESARLADLAA